MTSFSSSRRARGAGARRRVQSSNEILRDSLSLYTGHSGNTTIRYNLLGSIYPASPTPRRAVVSGRLYKSTRSPSLRENPLFVVRPPFSIAPLVQLGVSETRLVVLLIGDGDVLSSHLKRTKKERKRRVDRSSANEAIQSGSLESKKGKSRTFLYSARAMSEYCSVWA